MTQWYYSDTQRNRLGPVSAEEMASLHRSGRLSPDTLVWREGLSDWVAWRTIQTEIVPPGTPAPTPPPVAVMAPHVDPSVAHDLRAPAEPSSPYAPPTAAVGEPVVAMHQDDIVYAGLWKRFAAAVIDALVMLPVLIPLAILFGWTEEDTGLFSADTLVIMVVFTLYLGLMQARPAGASLGKMAVRIKVVRGDGTPMSLPRALGRSAVLQVAGQILRGVLTIVMGVMIPFTPRKQSIHDRMFDTVVVDKYAFTQDSHLQNPNLNGATIAVLVLFVLFFLLAVIGGALGIAALVGGAAGGGG